MKRLPVAPVPVAAFLLLAGCGAAASSQPDPQQPLPAGRADAPSKVVICPDGSSYDPVHNVCIATGVQRPASSGANTSGAAGTAGQAGVSARCGFQNGRVTVLPLDPVPHAALSMGPPIEVRVRQGNGTWRAAAR